MKYLFLIFTILIQFNLHSQVTKIDSLRKQISILEKHSTASLQDSVLVKTYQALSLAYYYNSELEKSQIEAKKELALSEKIQWNKGQISGYQDISYSEYKLGRPKSCLQLNYKALILAEQNQFLPEKLSSLRMIADTYNALNQKDSAIVFYKRLIPIYQKLNLKMGLGACYLNLATTLKDIHSKEDILTYYKKAEDVFTELKNEFWLGNIYYSMADYYLDNKEYTTSFYNLEKAIRYIKKSGNEAGLAGPYGELGYLFAVKKEYNQAIIYGVKSLKIAQKANVLEDTYWAYEALYLGHKGLKNDKEALFYHEEMLKTKTKLLETDTKQQIENYKKRYENEKQIQRQSIENQILTNKNQQTNLYYLIGLSLMFLILAIVLWRHNRRLIKKNAEIEEAHFRGQKTERKRVAEELHDNLGSQLSAMRWSILAMDKKQFNQTEQEIYDNILEMVDESYKQVRNLSHNLLPALLETEGLEKTLEKLIKKLNKNEQIHFELITENFPKQLDKKIEFELYSILLELINNIIKHSQASKATISIAENNNQIQIQVNDNGKGYTESDLHNGQGLLNIQKRVQQFNGRFDKIITEQGTDLVIMV
jgi:two-component system, NarL family, sensor histidine kinase LiaS